ncbi:Mevalonate kinase, partial [Trachymyrmex cornetzi]
FIVDLSSELPIGEGLGSSASFVVCLAACFWRWYLLQKGKREVCNRFNFKDLIHIAEYAMECEILVYDSSNMINTIISAYGMINIFKEKEWQTYDLSVVPSMKILLVFSNVSQQKIKRSLMEMKVKEHLSLSADFILNSIETISERFIRTLQKIDKETHSLKRQEIVETNSVHLINYWLYADNFNSFLIHMNQGLLRALGTSHPNLDIICAIARNSSLGGKIAAGRGFGYAFVLLLPSDSQVTLWNCHTPIFLKLCIQVVLQTLFDRQFFVFLQKRILGWKSPLPFFRGGQEYFTDRL